MSEAPFSGIIRYTQTGYDRGMEPATSGEWCAVSDAFARIEELDERLRIAVAEREAVRADRKRLLRLVNTEELESLVENAFREGVRAGLSDVPGPRTWEESASYRKLKGDTHE